MTSRSLPAVAIGMAVLAAVLLSLAIAQRCEGPGEEPPAYKPLGIAPQLRDDELLAAMYGAFCRRQLACGVAGTEQRCAYIEDTMRQMPTTFALPACKLDPFEARRCIADLLKRDCRNLARSLNLTDLQVAFDRVESCRLVCDPTASSP